METMTSDTCPGTLNGEGDAAPSLALRRDSDKVLEMTAHWVPPVPPWEPNKKPNSSLRIALISSDRLYQGLRFEGEILLLTPNNWRSVLRYGKPDFLLVESTWFTATGHWHMAQSVPGQAREDLEKLLRDAQRHSIPTVYWFTLDHVYHDHFVSFARKFDYVFCADSQESVLLQQNGILAKHLPPAVQPAIFNPVRNYGEREDFSLGVLYDGWIDLLHFEDNKNFIEKLNAYDLSIIESRSIIPKPQRHRTPKSLIPRILGCVYCRDLPTVLKYSQIYITLQHSKKTRTLKFWNMLEAAACRLPILRLGADGDNGEGLICASQHDNEQDLLLDLQRMYEDDFYRERRAHLNWRHAFKYHTFAHRIQTICREVKIEHDWVENPSAAVVTPTFRPQLFSKVIRQYDNQTYPEKKLVVLYNGDASANPSITDEFRGRKDIFYRHIPEENFTGTCLNMGTQILESDFYFKLDDDDFYGSNYILDSMLFLRAYDADLIGKVFCYFNVEGRNEIFCRESHSLPICRFKGKDLSYEKVGVSGCSLAKSRRLLNLVNYPNNSPYNSDAIFISDVSSILPDVNCLLTDRMNLVVHRMADETKHTWRISNEKLLSKSVLRDIILSDLFV